MLQGSCHHPLMGRWQRKGSGAACALALFLICMAVPTSGDIHWATSFGSTAFDGAYGVSIDYLGSAYVTGKFAGICPFGGGVAVKSNGEYDVFLAKFDVWGKVLWATRMGGEGSDWARDVATDKHGNAFVAGSFASETATFDDSMMAYGSTLKNAGEFDVFLTKVDAKGSVQWAIRGGGNGFDYAQDVATDGSGNVYVTGSLTSGIATFGGIMLGQVGATDSYVIQVDAHANVKWGVRWGGRNGNALAYSLAADAAGNVYVAGAFEGSIDLSPQVALHSKGSWDVFLVKMATTLPRIGEGGVRQPQGTAAGIIWAQSMGGSLNDAPKALDTDRDGNVIIAGSFSSLAAEFGGEMLHVTGKDNGFRRTQTYTGHPDLFVAKVNPLGSVAWAKGMGGSAEENGYGVATDNHGAILVTGEFASEGAQFGAFKLTSQGTRDVFLVKLATDGKVVAAVGAGGALEDVGRDVAVDHVTGNYLVTGHFASYHATFGPRVLHTHGSSDAFLLSLEDTHEATEGGWKSVLFAAPGGGSAVGGAGGRGWSWMEMAFVAGVLWYGVKSAAAWSAARVRSGERVDIDEVKAALSGERKIGTIQSILRRAHMHVYPPIHRRAPGGAAGGGGEPGEDKFQSEGKFGPLSPEEVEERLRELKGWGAEALSERREEVGSVLRMLRRLVAAATGQRRPAIHQVPFQGESPARSGPRAAGGGGRKGPGSASSANRRKSGSTTPGSPRSGRSMSSPLSGSTSPGSSKSEPGPVAEGGGGGGGGGEAAVDIASVWGTAHGGPRVTSMDAMDMLGARGGDGDGNTTPTSLMVHLMDRKGSVKTD